MLPIAREVEVRKGMENGCCSGQMEGALRIWGEVGGGQEGERGANFGSFTPCFQP